MATLEERVISGKGILRLNSTSADESKVINIFADVVREPTNPYWNSAYNPPRQRYATLNLMRQGYVLDTLVMEYPRQMWERYPDQGAQALYATACAYEGVLISLANISTALGLVVIQKDNNIKGWEHVKLWFDEIKVVCYADTAIRLVIEDIAYDFCPDLDEPDGAPPAFPPQDPPVVPPGQSLGGDNEPVSPPYDSPNDEGDTTPYPGDSSIVNPQPEGVACAIYQIDYTYTTTNGQTIANFGFIRGKYFTDITFASTGGSGYEFKIPCQAGSPTIQGIQQSVCQNDVSPRVFDTIAAAGIPVSAKFVSATPV